MILAGDFNRRNINRAIGNFPQIKAVSTPPTRGTAILDLLATNMTDLVIDSGVTDAITSEGGVPSDHNTVYFSFRMPRVPQYKIEQYSYHRITPEGTSKFGSWLEQQEENGWAEVLTKDDPSEMVEELHRLFNEAMDYCYEKKTRVKKTSEPVWMADWIRSMIESRRELFKNEGRSDRWHTFKKKITDIIKTRKSKHFEELRNKFLANKDPRSFHRCVRALLNGNGPHRWDVRSLAPDKSDLELADWLADFFNGISSEYEPLNLQNVPESHHRSLPELTTEQVSTTLRKAKKTMSMVQGDIYPLLYNNYHSRLAKPITHIFNAITEKIVWPAEWKVEHVTVIPKTSAAASPSECRNISCTNFLSKVYESFVLSWAREEVTPKRNQYGGKPGCSTVHFAVSVLDYVTSALEDNRAAVVLTSIDFSKAFNRLEHGACLKAFKKKGASSDILRLLASFLIGRNMTVKVGQQKSALRPVNAGAPQGSVLGCYLFGIGVDDIEEECQAPPIAAAQTETQASRHDFPAVSTPRRVYPNHLQEPSMSPITKEQDIEFLPRATNVPPWLLKPKDPRWRPPQDKNEKFVDDSIHMCTVNMRAEQLLEKEGIFYKETKAPAAQTMMEHITKRAEERGMVVNDSKTGVMCVSSAVSFEPRVVLSGRDGPITGSDSLKFLGVTLDSDCTFRSHVNNLRTSMRRRSWALSKLRRRGMKKEDLIKVYTSMIRPAVEYASPAWHSMLTGEQSGILESQQTQAMRNILGPGISARKMRLDLELDTLYDRRESAVLKFGQKCAMSERFQEWFPLRRAPLYERRRSVNYRTYEEVTCRTERHKNSPINYARRMMNEKTDK